MSRLLAGVCWVLASLRSEGIAITSFPDLMRTYRL